MAEDLVSVIITTYERESSLANAIGSVLSQSYENFELIIVDDGSSVDVNKILSSTKSKKIRYLKHKYNLGLSSSRNTGIQASKGKYVAFLDDDDKWKADKLEKQVKIFKDTNFSSIGLVSCWADQYDKRGKFQKTNQVSYSGAIKPFVNSGRFKTVPSSILIKRSLLERIRGFDERLKSHIDFDLWMKLAEINAKCYFVQLPLVNNYSNQENRLTSPNQKRLESTFNFINKWNPSWRRWFSHKPAQKLSWTISRKVLVPIIKELLLDKKIIILIKTYYFVIKQNPSAVRTNYQFICYTLFKAF